MDTTQMTHEHPAADATNLPIPDFLLMPIVEAAFRVIKKKEESEIPSTLRRISNFDSKALGHSTARTQIIQSLISNPEFATSTQEEFFSRSEVQAAYDQWSHEKAHDIVADAATRNDLPLIASMLWMKKPERYEFSLGLIVAYSAVSMLENEQRDSKRAQETKLTHLAHAVEKEKTRADLLKSDFDRMEGELREERKAKRVREQRFETQIAMLQKQVDNNETVASRLKEARDRQGQRVEREASRAHELESRLKNAHDEANKKSEKITHLQNQLASALSSEIQLTYEDLQNLILAQKEADTISKSLLAIMNKSRAILSKEQSVKSQSNQAPKPQPSILEDSEPPISKSAASIEPKKKQTREPVVVPQGLDMSSPQALKTIFMQDDLMVLIDGYNVSLNSFGDLSLELQRERTISCATSVETRHHPTCVIVFDGQSATTRGRVQSKVHVVFSPAGTTADDVIIERIRVTPLDKPVLVVTSDKNLAARAKGLGCESISSQSFVNYSR